jgi:DNA-binding NtrC family response regulator
MTRTPPSGELTVGDTRIIPSKRSDQRPLDALLHVTGAPATPPRFRLAKGRCVIGSGAGCDIVVSDATVSRQHVELVPVPDGVAVRDMGSTNGTLYLGNRVQEMILSFGGKVTLGAATVAIEIDPASLPAELMFDQYEYRGIVGHSQAMRRLFAMLARLEGSLVSVLIQGESGVGKELIARALHEGSSVAGGPLVAVNCGAFAREVIASELFGHRKGAFTGALDARKGAFASADGGTLFLDEIGEMPLDVQPMLLRALESGEVRPVGSDQPRNVKVRVVTATHRDLVREAAQGRFREDLLYRLAVVRLDVPPLRERPEDVAPLAQRFAKEVGLEALGEDVIAQLQGRPWEGNARELRNAVQAYGALGVVLGPLRQPAAMLEVALAESVDLSKPYLQQKEALVDAFTRVYLAALLDHTQGNKSAAAKISGLDRTYLGRLITRNEQTKR